MNWRGRLLATALLVLAAAQGARLLSWPVGWPGIDLYQMQLVAQAMPTLPEPGVVYTPDGRRPLGQARLDALRAGQGTETERAAAEINAVLYPDVIASNATPTLLGLASRLPWQDYARDVVMWRAAQVSAMALAAVLCAWVAGLPLWAGAGAAVLWLVGLPLTQDVGVANTSAFLVAGLAVVAVILRRPGASAAATGGLAVGLLAMVKPVVVLSVGAVLVLELAAGERRRALAAAVGVAAAVVLGAVLGMWLCGDAGIWAWWLPAARELSDAPYPLAQGNLSPSQQLGTPLAGLVLLAGVVAGAVRTGRHQAEPGRRALLALGAGGLAYVVFAPVVWAHYLQLLLPLWAVLVARSGPTRAVGLVAGLALVGWVPGPVFDLPSPPLTALPLWLGQGLLLLALWWPRPATAPVNAAL